MSEKLKPVNMNLFLGTIEKAQVRRRAYEEAAAKLKMTLSSWARTVLDKAAGFIDQ